MIYILLFMSYLVAMYVLLGRYVCSTWLLCMLYLVAMYALLGRCVCSILIYKYGC